MPSFRTSQKFPGPVDSGFGILLNTLLYRHFERHFEAHMGTVHTREGVEMSSMATGMGTRSTSSLTRQVTKTS